MVKVVNQDGKSQWFSTDNDWNNHEGHLICVWNGIIIKQEEYLDFKEFTKEETGADIEIIGEYKENEGLNCLVFLVKNCIRKFSIWRFNFPGMKFWFDNFAVINSGKMVDDNELLPIIEKLGLSVNIENSEYIIQEHELTEEDELCYID